MRKFIVVFLNVDGEFIEEVIEADFARVLASTIEFTSKKEDKEYAVAAFSSWVYFKEIAK